MMQKIGSNHKCIRGQHMLLVFRFIKIVFIVAENKLISQLLEQGVFTTHVMMTLKWVGASV